jgi:hypothetical protein
MLAQEQLQGEWQTIISLPVSHMARHAAGHDLVVLGQHNPDYSTGLDKPEDVILGCGRPVLVVPYGWLAQPIGGHVLIAWNGSREAMRAVQDALPVMALCDDVTVLYVNPEEDADIVLQAELVTHLARHGLRAIAETTVTASGVIQDAVHNRAKESRSRADRHGSVWPFAAARDHSWRHDARHAAGDDPAVAHVPLRRPTGE